MFGYIIMSASMFFVVMQSLESQTDLQLHFLHILIFRYIYISLYVTYIQFCKHERHASINSSVVRKCHR